MKQDNLNKKLTMVANWKMNPSSSNMALELLKLYIKKIDFHHLNLIVAPPALYLDPLNKILINYQSDTKVSLASQNICAEEFGAFTGEISANMLKNSGCSHVIIGHSERRKYYKEDDDQIAKKFITAVKYQLIPIVCIGETKGQFDSGMQEVQSVLFQQLKLIVEYVSNGINSKNNQPIEFFIAYEPVWAIGSGFMADMGYIYNICEYINIIIKNLVQFHKIKILYGGSVNKSNCKNILQNPMLAGALIGGASLLIDEFEYICKI